MPLPKIDQPIFTTILPSTEKPIRFRPFTVKEEKILLIAQESEDNEQIVTAVKQILSNCIIDDINVDTLPTFDIEFMLIQLRAKSVDNIVELKLKDDHTDEVYDVVLNLDDITVVRDDKHSQIIKLNADGMHMKMRYPTFNELALLLTAQENKTQAAMYEIMIDCIEMVVQGDNVFVLKDFSKEEINEFVDSLSTSHLNAIKEFFDTMPKLRHEIKYQNSKGEDRTFVIQGMDAFFI